jgi:Spectrin repeat
MFWINDKEAFVTAEEFGHDLEHVEVLQRKFEEFQKDMASQEYRIIDVCDTADKLASEQHPEVDVIAKRKAEVLEAWARLKSLAIAKQVKVLQNFFYSSLMAHLHWRGLYVKMPVMSPSLLTLGIRIISISVALPKVAKASK